MTAAKVRAVVFAAALVTAQAASFTITVLSTDDRGVARGASDPCQHYSCPAGEQCVVHQVRCTSGPCPRIGECRPIDCGLSCPAGSECRRPAGAEARCVPREDRCGGQCLPDEQCVEVVQPCLLPPCRQQQLCIGSGQVTARRLPPLCPPEAICPAGLDCIMTKACRRPDDCAYQMSCVEAVQTPDCTSHWCQPGEQCRMQEVQCTEPPCGSRPVCFTPEPPRCDPACGDREECTMMVLPCRVQPCSFYPRCTPRLPQLSSRFGSPFTMRQARSGACPVNDLKALASKVFCDNARLDRCNADRDCERGRRCCERGCGNACLPACPHACAAGEECRLVQVQCLGKPCPKVAQCVAAQPDTLDAADEESLDTLLPGSETNQPQPSLVPLLPASQAQEPPPPQAQQRPGPPAQAAQHRPAPLPQQTTTRRPAPTTTHRSPTTTTPPPATTPAIDFAPYGPAGAPIGPGFSPADGSRVGQQCGRQVCSTGERCRDIPCNAPPLCPRSCQPVVPDKPGSCPANEQPPSVICFQDRFVDSCFDDGDCPGSMRCCLSGCARRCRHVCKPGCHPGSRCHIMHSTGAPVCLPMHPRPGYLGPSRPGDHVH